MNDQTEVKGEKSTQDLIKEMNPPDGSRYHAGEKSGIKAAQDMVLQGDDLETGLVLGFIATMQGDVYDKATLAARIFQAIGTSKVLGLLEEVTGNEALPKAIQALLKARA